MSPLFCFMSNKNYAMGHAFSLKDLFMNFPINKLKIQVQDNVVLNVMNGILFLTVWYLHPLHCFVLVNAFLNILNKGNYERRTH